MSAEPLLPGAVIAGEASAWSPSAEMRPIERSVARSVPALALEVLLVDQALDGGGAGGGRAEPDSFIASAASSSSTSRPAVSMAPSSVASL